MAFMSVAAFGEYEPELDLVLGFGPGLVFVLGLGLGSTIVLDFITNLLLFMYTYSGSDYGLYVK